LLKKKGQSSFFSGSKLIRQNNRVNSKLIFFIGGPNWPGQV